MTESLMDRLRRLDKEATPIGWTTCKFGVSPRGEGGGFHWHPNGDDDAEANGQLIVAMRNALPELLRLVEAAQVVNVHVFPNKYVGALRDALRPLVDPPTESATP